MYVTQIYQMLQSAIREHHKQFPFPKADFNDASDKIKNFVGEFTKDLNEVLREEKKAYIEEFDKLRRQELARFNDAIDNAKSLLTVVVFILGISLAANIYFIFLA